MQYSRSWIKRLATAYSAAKTTVDENGLKAEQLRWMKEVRNKCTMLPLITVITLMFAWHLQIAAAQDNVDVAGP